MFWALRYDSGLAAPLRALGTRHTCAGEKPPGFHYTARRWGAHFLTGTGNGYRCLTLFTSAGPARLTHGEGVGIPRVSCHVEALGGWGTRGGSGS